MKAVVMLGCDGRQDSGFLFCRGASNVVLDLEKWQYSENFKQLIEYLKTVPKIFDSPNCSYGVVVNALYKMYQLNYLSDKKYKYISEFVDIHKACGLILSVKAKEVVDES